MPVEFVMDAEGIGGKFDGVYPDNILSVNVFSAMLTQWRVGASGATGLDLNVLPVVMKYRGVESDQEQKIFDDILVMEREALRIFSERKS